MSIDAINFGIQALKPIQPGQAAQKSNNVAEAGNGTSFSKMFSEAIKEVDQMQVEADKQVENLVLGNEGVTTHGAMIALEKADIAFQLMSSIRSKIIRAYEEVIRTQV